MTNTMTATRQFLDALWGFKGQQDWLLLWEKNGKRSHWFVDLDAASDFAAGRVDLYIGCGLSGENRGASKRATEAQVVCIPGFWCDVDFGGNAAHKSLSLPPDQCSAMVILEELDLPPTMVIHSGFGLQAWWLLETPFRIENLDDRNEAKRISQSLQNSLISVGRSRGWKVDSVGDLSRILRVPGTLNGKSDPPILVQTLSDDGPRYASIRDIVSPRGTVELEVAFCGASSEGSRNTDAASLVGRLAVQMLDPFDSKAIDTLWEVVKSWNRGNNPPLEEREFGGVFRSIIRSEQNQRSEQDHSSAFKRLEATEGRLAEDRGTWGLVIVDSRPPLYKLFSPHWEGSVELTTEQYASWTKLRLKVIEEKRVGLGKELARAWEKTPKNGEALFAKLLREAVTEGATPEESTDSRLALAILSSLMGASYRQVTSTTRETPSKQQEDDSIVFSFRWLVGDINKSGTSRVTEESVARMLALVKCGEMRVTNVRFKRITISSISRLSRISDGEIGKR